MAEPQQPFLVEPEVVEWLHSHPGCRCIISVWRGHICFELCARKQDGLAEDSDRYMSNDGLVQPGDQAELVRDMRHWEIDDYAYDEDVQQILANIFGKDEPDEPSKAEQ